MLHRGGGGGGDGGKGTGGREEPCWAATAGSGGGRGETAGNAHRRFPPRTPGFRKIQPKCPAFMTKQNRCLPGHRKHKDMPRPRRPTATKRSPLFFCISLTFSWLCICFAMTVGRCMPGLTLVTPSHIHSLQETSEPISHFPHEMCPGTERGAGLQCSTRVSLVRLH